MNKNILIAIGAVIVVLVASVYLGFIEIDLDDLSFFSGNDVPQYQNSEELDMGRADIYYILCVLTSKNLNRDTTYDFIDRLDMQIYGTNDHYTVVTNYYRTYYSSWNNVLDTGSALSWTSGTNAASVFTSSLPVVRTMYNYETLVMTGYGPIDDYNSFYQFIITS